MTSHRAWQVLGTMLVALGKAGSATWGLRGSNLRLLSQASLSLLQLLLAKGTRSTPFAAHRLNLTVETS